jgi:Zn-finger protein
MPITTALRVPLRPAAALTVGAVVLLVLPVCGADNAPEQKAQSVFCPVVGLPQCEMCQCPLAYCARRPRERNTVAFAGGKVMFCCPKCKEMFEKSAAKFAANAHHQLVATGQFRQVKCARCGGELGQVPSLQIAGISVRFCSNACYEAAVKASHVERVEMIFGAKVFARGFVPVNK